MSAARDWLAASASATPEQRQAVARAIGSAAPYAIAPFVAMQTGDGWRLAACLNPPPHLDADGMAAWQPDGDIVLIDPMSGAATLASDDGGLIVGEIGPLSDCVTLYTNAVRWARAWALSRAAWLDLHKRANVPGIPLREPPDHGLPGLLLAGPLATVCDWSPLRSRQRVQIEDPMTARQIGQALLGAACLPAIDVMTSKMMEAA
jgi:hypothetical protein